MRKFKRLNIGSHSFHVLIPFVFLTCFAVGLSGDQEQNGKPHLSEARLRPLWTRTVPEAPYAWDAFSFVSADRVAVITGKEEGSKVESLRHLWLLNATDGTTIRQIELTSRIGVLGIPKVASAPGNKFLVLYGGELKLFNSEIGIQVRSRSLEYPSKNDVWRIFTVPGANTAVLLFSPYGLGHKHQAHWVDINNLEDSGVDFIENKWRCLSASSRFLACVPTDGSGGVWFQERGAKQLTILCPNHLAGPEMFLDDNRLAINENKKKGFVIGVYNTGGAQLWTRQFGSDKMPYVVSTAPSAGRILVWVRPRWVGPREQELFVLDASTGTTIAKTIFAPKWVKEVGPYLTHSYMESSEAALSPDGSKVAVRIGNELTVYALEKAEK